MMREKYSSKRLTEFVCVSELGFKTDTKRTFSVKWVRWVEIVMRPLLCGFSKPMSQANCKGNFLRKGILLCWDNDEELC